MKRTEGFIFAKNAIIEEAEKKHIYFGFPHPYTFFMATNTKSAH